MGEGLEREKITKAWHVQVMSDPPMLGSVVSLWSFGRGSGTMTSSPAARMRPDRSASYRSSWFTTPPLQHNNTK
ncbi:hypothetical protein JTE90_029587 [Oedothorax gibbosus]|uniref:Uncharacterized protein n=1 Tax=Oedothorax gibbosus TaxID=931172 RepID=A0AAV6VB06_9ARAC|nr:hypothetical protein JTE90_029587 [Oedothorax gibbosus]